MKEWCCWRALTPRWRSSANENGDIPHFVVINEVRHLVGELFDVYDNEKIVGDLAERWEIANEGKRLTFFLRQGVKFHDGKAFTCADAKYSIDKLADPKRANRAFVAILENIYEKSTCENDSTMVQLTPSQCMIAPPEA